MGNAFVIKHTSGCKTFVCRLKFSRKYRYIYIYI